MSKLAVVVVSAAALVLVSVAPAVAAATVPPGYTVAAREAIYPGVDFEQIKNPAGPVLADVAHVAPGAPVDVRAVSSNDKIPTRTSDLETTSGICRRVGCVVAVNGDFHVNGQPMGGVVTGGVMLRSPDPTRAQIWVDDGGHLGAGAFPWSAALRLSDGSVLPISAVNVNPGAGTVLYTPAWGPSTPASGGIELVLSSAGTLGPLNRPVPVTLQGLRPSPGGIPAGGAVISVPASAADQLNGVWARVQQGLVSAQANVVVATPVNAVESIGTTPVVLHGGQPALPWPNDPNVVAAVQPRTLVGWNAAGDVWFVVVDGRQTSSAGLTMAQAANLLTGLGATEAANLDGGGGSTFVVGGTVWNQPSDAPTKDPSLAERVASNAFVLLPQSGGPPAPKLPPRPAPGTGLGSGGATPPAAGAPGSDPSRSSGPGGSAPVLGPPGPGPVPGSGLSPLLVGEPLLTARPGDPEGTILGGLLGGPGGILPIGGLPGLFNTASTSGRGRLLGLLAATGVPIGFLPVAGDPGTGGAADGQAAVASASSGAGPAHPTQGGAGWTAVSGPLLALVRDGGRPIPLLPSGGMSGGAVVAEWLVFGLVWGRRRIRRRRLSPTGSAGRQPVSGIGPGPSSRRWPRPRMWTRVTRCHIQSPLALVTSNVALKR